MHCYRAPTLCTSALLLSRLSSLSCLSHIVQAAEVYAEGSCFRIITEPTVIRPNKGAYGMPYDLVATGTETAIEDMLAKLRDADISLEQ